MTNEEHRQRRVPLERRCRALGDERGTGEPLATWLSRGSVVLVGAPGLGKSTCLQDTAAELGARCLDATELVHGDAGEHAGATLLIDALDELAIGSGDAARAQLPRVAQAIRVSGCERFVLACRDAQWFDQQDRSKLEKISRIGDVCTLALLPLERAAIERIVRSRDDLDPDAFLVWIDRRALGPLVENPQTLVLLLDAFAAGERPETRRDTFESAVKAAVLEVNVEHGVAGRRGELSDGGILDAAGRLAAVALISGTGQVSRQPTPEPTVVALPDVGEIDVRTLDSALGTRLFTTLGDGRYTFAHRQIGEYLAARYLAALARTSDLPLVRVHALLAAPDGAVVEPLRGLFGWLATLAHDPLPLLEIDPSGSVLFGDVSALASGHRTRLLELLREHTRTTHWLEVRPLGPQFAGFATEGARDSLRRVLETRCTDDADRTIVRVVLEALCTGPVLTGLESPLDAIVRDDEQWPLNRHLALRALHRVQPFNDAIARDRTMLADIAAGTLEDGDDEILGRLLDHGWPDRLNLDEIFVHLHALKEKNLFGAYRGFWSIGLEHTLSDDMMAPFLDKLAVVLLDERRPCGRTLSAAILYWLIQRAVESLSDPIDPKRVGRWVRLPEQVSSGWDGGYGDKESRKAGFREWLARRPGIALVLIEHEIEVLVAAGRDEPPGYLARRARRRLLHFEPVADFAERCLERSRVLGTTPVARALHWLAFDRHCSDPGSSSLTLQAFVDDADGCPERRRWYDACRSCPMPIGDEEDDRAAIEEQKAATSAAWDDLRSRALDMLSAPADAPLDEETLMTVADVYLGRYRGCESGAGRENLRQRLALDNESLDAIERLFRDRLAELDLPSVDEVIDSHLAGRRRRIASAVLVGLQETISADPEAVRAIDPDRYAVMLAMGFVHDGHREETSLNVLIAANVELAARTALRVLERAVKDDKHETLQHYLSSDSACLPLLKYAHEELLGLHRRGGRVLAASLVGALLTIMRGRLPAELLGLVLDELWEDVVPLDEREGARYLIAGLLADSEGTERRFDAWIRSANQLQVFVDELARLKRMTRDIESEEGAEPLARTETSLNELSDREPTLGLLLSRLVPRVPDGWGKGDSDNDMPDMGKDRGMVMSFLIDQAVQHRSPAIGGVLDTLIADPQCASWRHRLRRARADQQTIARLAQYTHPLPSAILRTLGCGSPASAPDLQALALDHLDGLRREIDGSNSNAFRPYWNEVRGKPETPKYEESCRDAMINELRVRLSRQLVVPEAYHRDGKRVDLKLFSRDVPGLALPMEIKRADHEGLWTAPYEQLERRYLTDDDCRSHGIYIVLWFGPIWVKNHSEHGKASSPGELEAMLTTCVDETTSSHIVVKVIDVSIRSYDAGQALNEPPVTS